MIGIAEAELADAPLPLLLLFQQKASTDIAFQVVITLLVPLPLVDRSNAGFDISQLLQNLFIAFNDILLLMLPYDHVKRTSHGERPPHHDDVRIVSRRLHFHGYEVWVIVFFSDGLLVDLVS